MFNVYKSNVYYVVYSDTRILCMSLRLFSPRRKFVTDKHFYYPKISLIFLRVCVNTEVCKRLSTIPKINTELKITLVRCYIYVCAVLARFKMQLVSKISAWQRRTAATLVCVDCWPKNIILCINTSIFFVFFSVVLHCFYYHGITGSVDNNSLSVTFLAADIFLFVKVNGHYFRQ